MSTTHTVLAMVAAGLLTLAPRAARAQSDASRTIAGQITDTRGAGLPGAHVDLTDQDTGLRLETLAHAGGRYALGGVLAGHRYDVLVRCIGYAPSDRALAVETSAAAGPFNVSLAPLERYLSFVGR
jgi:Carboxypeptidase regulatory-like domain